MRLPGFARSLTGALVLMSALSLTGALFLTGAQLLTGCSSPEESAPIVEVPFPSAFSPVVDITRTSPGDWVPLFNGTDLAGWTPKVRGFPAGEDPLGTFIVQDSAITVSYAGYADVFGDRFGHLFHETPRGWYHLEVEYRFTGDQIADGPGWARRNSGVMIHGQAAETMGLSQDFPASIEVQLLGGNGKDERSTANLCTPGTNVVYAGVLDTRHCIESSSLTYHGDGWVHASITVLGDSLVVHSVEGGEVLRYEKPQLGGGNVEGHDPSIVVEGRLLAGGTISLQSESHPVQFRRVDLLPLEGCMDESSPAFRPYFLRSDPSRCTADGRPAP